MDISQTMIGHHLQHPLGPGAILYPGKGSAWQPVVTSLPSMVDIPKESIIANTDFTTTSVIAKRRLSSKKRKKAASQQQSGAEGSTSSTSLDHRSSCSPMGSANASPAVSSTTYTPPAFDKNSQSQGDSLSRPTPSSIASHNITTSSHSGITSSSSSSHTLHHIAHHPPVNAAGVQFHHHPSVSASGQFISVAPVVTSSFHHHHQQQHQHPIHPTVATAQTQFAHPMLSQLQQELNYRFLQDGSSGVLIAHPNQVDQPQPSQQQVHGFRHHLPARRDSAQAMDVSTSSSASGTATHGDVGGSRRGFKWCYAHVAIAKQIQQQQARAKKQGTSASSLTTSSLSTSHMTHGQSNSASSITNSVPVSVAAATQQQQQQQQQLALLQMYGLPATGAIPATAMPGGYMAVPYSSMQEVQMRMQLAAAANATGTASLHHPGGGVSLVKPVVGMDSVAGGAETLLSFNPAAAAAATCGPTTVQMVNGLHLQAAAPFGGHSIPLAAVAAAPSDVNNAVFHGAASGQWMAPVPVVGSCIVNPLQQPGIMATPWVK